MASAACESIEVCSDVLTSGVSVKVVSNGQSVKATCAALVATYYWGAWQKAAHPNDKVDVRDYVLEVWHV